MHDWYHVLYSHAEMYSFMAQHDAIDFEKLISHILGFYNNSHRNIGAIFYLTWSNKFKTFLHEYKNMCIK